ncbi:MAG: GNAT family N-acetyltransferase [Burkholderiales bacterium]|nr:GNAT family N-acetyltransferase [Burkholderiales bacterium]
METHAAPRTGIQPARSEDCETLHALVRGLAEYEKLAHAAVGSIEDLRSELFGPRPAIEAALAREGERAVGFALWFHTYSTFLARRGLWLEDLFVVPETRGRGHGKALLKYCARLAVARGCGRFEWSVLDWNAPSIAFYEAAGATVMSDWRICRMAGDALCRFASDKR